MLHRQCYVQQHCNSIRANSQYHVCSHADIRFLFAPFPGISVWFWPRGSIPDDISNGNPDPTTWGAPNALFPNNDSCNTAAHFYDHSIVIDTTLCGDWAGAAFSGDGCPGTCSDFVADPANFNGMYLHFLPILITKPNCMFYVQLQNGRSLPSKSTSLRTELYLIFSTSFFDTYSLGDASHVGLLYSLLTISGVSRFHLYY